MKKGSMRIPVIIAVVLLVVFAIYMAFGSSTDSFLDIENIRVSACNSCCRSDGVDSCDPNNKCNCSVCKKGGSCGK